MDIHSAVGIRIIRLEKQMREVLKTISEETTTHSVVNRPTDHRTAPMTQCRKPSYGSQDSTNDT